MTLSQETGLASWCSGPRKSSVGQAEGEVEWLLSLASQQESIHPALRTEALEIIARIPRGSDEDLGVGEFGPAKNSSAFLEAGIRGRGTRYLLG